ncbi:hypothetical protein NDI54_06945 [Haloarcula sp. S1AR25-5A]|uniref:CARDB domain-containing protein n=1 Tax=Haloarcula terrestris TaxID=2950533 RepID=A0AAE4EVR1_9EURY|nr:CARDB domain-containing protein [Haloarcula terrestris]MDS0221080.1 hypothetical protein [Haloarcula terrestris]
MFEWGSRGAGDRGVSHVLGVVLLASAVIIGAVLIVQVGQQTIGDVNNDANVELAEEVMLSVDQSFQRSDTDESIEIPDRVRSDVDVSSEAAYNLTLNGRPACSTGNRSLQTMRYQEDGQQVGYQGGGVWRMTESGATMSSPPAVNYDEGALSLSFANISGQQINGDSVSVHTDRNATRNHEQALGEALYTNWSYAKARSKLNNESTLSGTQKCDPRRVTDANLTIKNSDYARAWADWAQSTYDDKYVEVTPNSAEPGETIHIRFALGDVSDPAFEVDRMSVKENSSDNQKALVTATVRNTGGLQDTQAIQFNRSGASKNKTVEVTLAEEESITVNKSLNADNGTHNFTVASNDDEAYEIINYTSVPGSPSLNITNASIPASARLNQVPSATVTVNNTGTMTADQNVTFLVNGSVNATRSVTIHPGNNTTVDFGPAMPTSENGTYDIEVTTDDDTYSQSSEDGHYFVVGDSGVYEITSVSPPGGLQSGEKATIGATIENTGDVRKSEVATITIKNESGTEVYSESKTLTLDGTRSGAENETVSITSGALTTPSYSNYTYIVETPDDTVNGTFTVGKSAPPVFDVTSVSVDNPVGPENETEVGFTVTNTGGEPDSQTLRISSDWTDDTSSDEQLDPGENTTVTQTVTAPSEEGFYRLNFTTENQTTWRILNVQSDLVVERDGSGLTTKERVNASIELKGAELEGSGWDYISHAYVTMSLDVQNQSGQHTIPLWRDVGYDFEDGDVNGPYAERRLINDAYADPYEYSKTFEKNSSISVVAKSYSCHRYEYTGVTFKINERWYDTARCSDPAGVRISISDPENSQNVDILADGERLPGYGQAEPEQRSLEDMLGEQRLNETEDSDRASLNLADGERVFLYELSKEDANPDNAGSTGDPDYNDAVVLFRTNALERDVTEPRFKILDVDAPARVDENTDATVTATIKNVGNASGTAKLTTTFDGSPYSVKTETLESGSRHQFDIDLATSSKTPGQSYQYKLNLTNPDSNATAGGKEWGGNVYVGEEDGPFMQVDSVRAPGTINDDESANATVTIANVGEAKGTAEIELYTKNTDHPSPSFSQHDSATISPLNYSETEQLNLSLPTDRGNYTYYVTTRDSTSAKQSFFVGQSHVVVNDTQGVNIGAEAYDTSTLIERRGGAQRMTVEVLNTGTVGDDRKVKLTVENKSDGGTAFTGSTTVTAGSGDLTGVEEYPAWAGYDVDLDPGYYTYEVAVYNETSSDPEDTATGELYLKEIDERGATGNDSPISIDSEMVTIGG